MSIVAAGAGIFGAAFFTAFILFQHYILGNDFLRPVYIALMIISPLVALICGRLALWRMQKLEDARGKILAMIGSFAGGLTLLAMFFIVIAAIVLGVFG
jgi:hypothetical protein